PVRRFVCAPRFARVAALLLGVCGVRLYHDQALFKEPGGRPTPWHRDQYYWPLDTDDTVTMWMPLVGYVAARRFALATAPLRAGDATFHSGRTLHSARPNLSPARREVMTVIY